VPGLGRHLRQDLAAPRHLLADELRVLDELGGRLALRDLALELLRDVDSGVESSCAAPAASVPSDASFSLRASRSRVSRSSRSRAWSALCTRLVKYAVTDAASANAIQLPSRRAPTTAATSGPTISGPAGTR
jgi:hypothetical protein